MVLLRVETEAFLQGQSFVVFTHELVGKGLEEGLGVLEHQLLEKAVRKYLLDIV